ncbi:hypothetical protein Ancab_003737 [Ancistrocladus abbreviatus]
MVSTLRRSTRIATGISESVNPTQTQSSNNGEPQAIAKASPYEQRIKENHERMQNLCVIDLAHDLKRRKRATDVPDEAEKKKEKKRKGKATGEEPCAILVPVPLSDSLIKFLGTGGREPAHCEVLKQVWDHIKDKNLQDPSDRRLGIRDGKLKELFGIDSFRGRGFLALNY